MIYLKYIFLFAVAVTTLKPAQATLTPEKEDQESYFFSICNLSKRFISISLEPSQGQIKDLTLASSDGEKLDPQNAWQLRTQSALWTINPDDDNQLSYLICNLCHQGKLVFKKSKEPQGNILIFDYRDSSSKPYFQVEWGGNYQENRESKKVLYTQFYQPRTPYTYNDSICIKKGINTSTIFLDDIPLDKPINIDTLSSFKSTWSFLRQENKLN